MRKVNWSWKRKESLLKWSKWEMVTLSTEQESNIQNPSLFILRKSLSQSMNLRQSQETVSERSLLSETSKMEMTKEELVMNGLLLVLEFMCLELKRVWVRSLNQRSLRRTQLWELELKEPVRIIKVTQERMEKNGWSETWDSISLRLMKKLLTRILWERWSLQRHRQLIWEPHGHLLTFTA